MKLFIPKEHGAWAMLIMPFILGMLLSSPKWAHLILFIGILSCYLATGPVLSYIRQPKLGKLVIPPFLLFSIVGLAFILPIVWLYPFVSILLVAIVPFFAINILFAKLKKERMFGNDLIAIFGFSIFVLIAYYIGNEHLSIIAIMIMFLNISFFVASVFHIKTFIREKGNQKFKYVSNLYHGLIVMIPITIGLPFIALAFAISALKTWFMPRDKKIKPITLGLIEMGNSLAFILVLVLAL